MSSKKYYWLRLQRDFFKRHDIRIIENMPNGKDYILFYLKLLVESIDHEGELRFSETIPYNEEMLATITDTNIDIVRSAMKIFSELGMIEILEDSTIFMSECQKMIGSATDDEKREQWRIRQQRHRDKLKLEEQSVTSRDSHVTSSLELEIEKEIDIELEIDNICAEAPKPAKPKKHKYGTYNNVLLTDDEYSRLVADYGIEKLGQAIEWFSGYIAEKGYKSKSHNLAMRRWVFDAVSKHNPQPVYSSNSTDIDWSKV